MITPDLAAFLEGEVAIHIATHNERLEPNGARVAAVTVDADGTHVTAYLPKIAAGTIVADLEASRQAALVFARLLADLNKRPVWVGHDPEGPLERFDSSSLRGCSCC